MLVETALIDKNRCDIERINMNPHQLELFYHVAKLKEVSRAARQMPYGIQQPSVNAQVNALERDFGVALYERRSFKLTSAGEELFRFVEPFFGRIAQVREKLQGAARIRLGASPIIFRDYLPPVIEAVRRRFLGLNMILRALIVQGVTLARVEENADALQIRIDPEESFQTIDGFGASDAWQCQFVGANWPLEKRQRIADLLFNREVDAHGNPKGIGLSIWRFNIGAGTAEQGDGSDIRNPWRRAECFQNPDGSYDWSRQAGHQWFLKAAHERGVEKLLSFPNSPPAYLTQNGKGYAVKGPPHLNIKPGKLDNYAAFLADVLEHFDKEGLHFDYLSPINEPQWAWDDPKQEGTPALNIELYALIRYLSQELSHRKLTTQLAIGEAGTIGHAFMSMDSMGLKSDGRDAQAQFFFSPKSPFYIGDLPHVAPIISAHSYHSVWPLDKQVEYRQRLHDTLQAVNPNLGYWMSEYCILERNDEIGGGGRRDLGMGTALFVTRIIHNDLTIAQARSWQWWTAVSEVNFKDGLLYLDDGSKGESGNMGPGTSSLWRTELSARVSSSGSLAITLALFVLE